MTNIQHNTHTEPVFKDLKLLKLYEIFDIQCMNFSTDLQITPCRSTFILYSDTTAISMKSRPAIATSCTFSRP